VNRAADVLPSGDPDSETSTRPTLRRDVSSELSGLSSCEGPCNALPPTLQGLPDVFRLTEASDARPAR
jgi:hypothetical protein